MRPLESSNPTNVSTQNCEPIEGSPLSNGPMLFYLVDWLPPDFGAVGQYGLTFAHELAQNGRHVCLVGLTSGPATTQSRKVGSGVLEIQRISSRRYGKSSYLVRLIWTFRTNMRLIWKVIRRRNARNSEMLFTGAPPFMLFF